MRNRQNNAKNPPLRILQLNTYKSSPTVHALLNAACGKFDLLLLQEPWYGNIGNDHDGPTAHESWQPILPCYPIPQGTRPRVMAYISRDDRWLRRDLEITARTDLIDSLDAQVLEIRLGRHPPILIGNIYNAPVRMNHDLNTVKTVMETHWPRNIPIVLTGDWNLHHPLWEPARGSQTNQPTEDFVQWLHEHGFELMNNPDEPTFFGHRDDYHTTIDLTFINEAASEGDIVREWIVDRSWSVTSDHAAIRWIFDPNTPPVDTSPHLRRNFKDAQAPAFMEAFRAKLDAVVDVFDPLSKGNETLPEELERAAVAFSDCLEAAVNETVPLRRRHPRAKEWWSAELSQKLAEVAEIQRRSKEERRAFGTQLPETARALFVAKRRFIRHVRKAKKKHAEEKLADARPSNLYTFRRWTQGKREYPSPSFDRGQGQAPAVHHADKCRFLRERLFPAPPDTGETIPDLTVRRPGEMAFPPPTRREVYNAIFNPDPKKAPGPDGITFIVLRWAWWVAEEEFFLLISTCATCGYHPKIWRSSIGVAIRKPRKPDYSQACAWRVIWLKKCISKVLEGFETGRFKQLALMWSQLYHGQFGGIPGRSTADAILTFVHDIETAWRHGKAVTALTFDVKGAFDHVSHAGLIKTLLDMHFPLEMVRWTASFISEQQMALCLDGRLDDMKPVRTGIPQGSPASPILFALFTTPLYHTIQRHFTENRGNLPHGAALPVPIAYVDDGMVYIASDTLNSNVSILSEVWDQIESWGTRTGVKFDPDKKEVMHYYRGHRDWIPPPITLRMQNSNNPTQVLYPREQVRWLGVHFDRELKFFGHVRTMSAKALKALTALKMLANTRKGLKQTILRTLYTTCILPILTYASPAWWTDASGSKTMIKQLERVQNMALRWICGAFRTTPIRALEIEASIMPLRHHLNWLNEKYALRFNRMDGRHPIIQRLPSEWRNGHEPTFPPLLPPPTRRSKPTRLLILATKTNPLHERIFPLRAPPWQRTAMDKDLRSRLRIAPKNPQIDKDEAARQHRKFFQEVSRDPSQIIVYSDGSLVEQSQGQQVGIGVVGYLEGQVIAEHSFGIGQKAEVYDAELEGLAHGAEFYCRVAADRVSPVTIRKITLCADNNSAIQRAFEGGANPGMDTSLRIRNAILHFLDSHPQNEFEIRWVPGHNGIEGNERSDYLAKRGAFMQQHSITSLTHALRRAKEKALEAWREEWRRTPPRGGYAFANRVPPSLEPSQHFKCLAREVYARLIQCRTGHAFIGEYYHRFVPSEDTSCPCGERFQTRAHVIQDCPIFRESRGLLSEVVPDLNLADVFGTKDGIQALGRFLARTNAFKKQPPALLSQSEEVM